MVVCQACGGEIEHLEYTADVTEYGTEHGTYDGDYHEPGDTDYHDGERGNMEYTCPHCRVNVDYDVVEGLEAQVHDGRSAGGKRFINERLVL